MRVGDAWQTTARTRDIYIIVLGEGAGEVPAVMRFMRVGVLLRDELAGEEGVEENLGVRNWPLISGTRRPLFFGVSMGLLMTELESPSNVDWL